MIQEESEEISSYMIQLPLSLVSKIGSPKREHQSWQGNKHECECLGRERQGIEEGALGQEDLSLWGVVLCKLHFLKQSLRL